MSDTEIQIHRIFINATPERVWAAITSAEFSRLYGYAGDVDYDLQPGGHFEHRAGEDMKAVGMPDVVVTGEVLEADPPRRLVLGSDAWQLVTDALTDRLAEVTEELARWRAAAALAAGPAATDLLSRVRQYLSDDLDTPKAIAALDGWSTDALTYGGADPQSPRVFADIADALLGVAL